MDVLLNEEVVNVAEEVVEDVVENLPDHKLLKIGGTALVVGAVAGATVWAYKKYVKPIRKVRKGKKVHVLNNTEAVNKTEEKEI